MKYKLLATGGKHFVCLEDGTRLPFQIYTVVTQNSYTPATVKVSAYADKRMGSPTDKRLEVDVENGTVSLCGLVLRNIRSLSVQAVGEISLVTVEFEVDCEIVDSIQAPVNLNDLKTVDNQRSKLDEAIRLLILYAESGELDDLLSDYDYIEGVGYRMPGATITLEMVEDIRSNPSHWRALFPVEK